MAVAGYVVAAVLGVALLGISAMCASAAGRNHLSPWWFGCYASLIGGLVLITETTAPMAAAAAGH